MNQSVTAISLPTKSAKACGVETMIGAIAPILKKADRRRKGAISVTQILKRMRPICGALVSLSPRDELHPVRQLAEASVHQPRQPPEKYPAILRRPRVLGWLDPKREGPHLALRP